MSKQSPLEVGSVVGAGCRVRCLFLSSAGQDHECGEAIDWAPLSTSPSSNKELVPGHRFRSLMGLFGKHSLSICSEPGLGLGLVDMRLSKTHTDVCLLLPRMLFLKLCVPSCIFSFWAEQGEYPAISYWKMCYELNKPKWAKKIWKIHFYLLYSSAKCFNIAFRV